jgi:hypothetical protein
MVTRRIASARRQATPSPLLSDQGDTFPRGANRLSHCATPPNEPLQGPWELLRRDCRWFFLFPEVIMTRHANAKIDWMCANQVAKTYKILGWRLNNLVVDDLVRISVDHARFPARLYYVPDIEKWLKRRAKIEARNGHAPKARARVKA